MAKAYQRILWGVQSDTRVREVGTTQDQPRSGQDRAASGGEEKRRNGAEKDHDDGTSIALAYRVWSMRMDG